MVVSTSQSLEFAQLTASAVSSDLRGSLSRRGTTHLMCRDSLRRACISPIIANLVPCADCITLSLRSGSPSLCIACGDECLMWWSICVRILRRSGHGVGFRSMQIVVNLFGFLLGMRMGVNVGASITALTEAVKELKSCRIDWDMPVFSTGNFVS